MARRLIDAPDAAVNLAGQGVRDVTRVAASDPELWVQILGANAAPVREHPAWPTATTSTASSTRSTTSEAPGARRRVAEELAGGNAGVARLPGQARHRQALHEPDRAWSTTSPGQLARLLAEIGEIGVNLEDLRLEHSPGAQVGLAEISVLPEAVERLTDELAARGWRIAG